MRPERITIDEVLEIFADYLEQAKNDYEDGDADCMGCLRGERSVISVS